MPKTHIITDTDCSIPLDLSARLGIHQVPITVQFGDDAFKAAIELDDRQTFERIEREGRLPTTAAPSPGQYLEAFKAAFNDSAESLACFCVSGEVSATYSAALNAAEMLPDRDISVVDSRSLAMGQGFMVLAAAEAAAQGAGIDAVLKAASAIRPRTRLFAALPTLKYLAMSGRVGSLAAGMAGLLNIQPILTIQDGRLDLLERARTRRKAWNRLIERSLEALGSGRIERLSIVHVDADDAARDFEARLREHLDCPDEVIYAGLTPGLSVHTGAGLVGLAFVIS